ncbi:hypothetical protein EV361DRAFT_910107 [Lentinula raphanica]|nr:hypothetical protein F5880DRAFT_1488661 [Lentinula raphanica]KAJ3971609.1 hypothetical protein EV361DRAFT_910107 [Lentinula raphanica]
MEAPIAKPKDDEFYYDCRTFLVENHLFRLPIHHLAAQSSYFQNLADTTKDGLTEDNPIDLDGASREDFRQLLRVLCPPRTFQAEPETLSLSQWESVLKLTKKWELDKVKTHAISAVEKLPNVDPVDKIILARTYDVRPWLAPSFNEILQRSKSLTESDVERLGIPTAVHLMGLRDRLRPSGPERKWSLGSERLATVIDFKSLIWDTFPDSKCEEKCEARSVPASATAQPKCEEKSESHTVLAAPSASSTVELPQLASPWRFSPHPPSPSPASNPKIKKGKGVTYENA